MLIMSGVCHAFMSVLCCIVVTRMEMANLLALVCDVNCDFVTFPFGTLGQVWYLILSIPDPSCLSYFECIYVFSSDCMVAENLKNTTNAAIL